MSEKIIGVIEEITIKPGNTNGKDWKRYAFRISGKTYSSFDEKVEGFKIGDSVEVEYLTKDNYHNITSMKLSDGQVPVVQPGTAVPSPMSYKDNTELSIVSQVILKAVADMVCAGKIEQGAFKSNALVLVETYKETKKKLSE